MGQRRSHLVDRLFAGHLDAVVAALRSRYRLGTRLAWGNTAAAIASALGALGTADGAPPLLDRVRGVIDALPHGIGALGAWGARGGGDWAYGRRTCCLWWKTAASGGALCEDCSLR